ncbi:MAG: hypothetical protein DELT_01537 [Desulfovibrio sp.]
MGKIAPRSSRVNALCSITDALAVFLDQRGGRERARLTLLWDHWEMVMGKDLAAIAIPLGHKKDALFIAAEDSMAAQEIAMQADEVLLRANAFMNGHVFSRVQVELVMGRNDLSRTAPVLREPPPEYETKKPEQLGSLIGVLDPESPVTKCYEAYVRYFSRA